MSARRAVVAGRFYPGRREECLEEVTRCLAEAPKIGKLPGTIVAGIVPHAGWTFSGDLAALVFSAVKQVHESVDTFVIFGAIHSYSGSAPAVYDRGGWDAVNALYTDKPPLSTEQIIHHEKYFEYEAPLDIEFHDAPDNYSLRFTSVVGEKLLSEIIDYNSGYYWGGIGSGTGWGGDRFYYFEDGEDFLAVMATKWDSDVDNQNFENDISAMYDGLGDLNDGIYRIRGHHLYFESHSDTTMIYYGSNEEVVRGFLG